MRYFLNESNKNETYRKVPASINLRLQLVRRVVRKHIDRRCLFCKEVGNDIGRQFQRRTEITALHIVKDGMTHLTGNGTATAWLSPSDS